MGFLWIQLKWNIPLEELDYWECHYIRECDTFIDNGCGYNATNGGKQNRNISLNTKLKISKSMREK